MGVGAHTVVGIWAAGEECALSICIFETRSGPTGTWVPHQWIQRPPALPSWVFCLGSLMDLPL